jgi:heme/copper-type cytochrome/quinol oxidase subunit 4
MNYRKVGYNLQKHWRELLSFALSVLSSCAAFIFSNQPGTTFWASILLTIIFSVATIYLILQEKVLYFISLDNYKDKENWFGAGKFEYDKTNNAYLIADTDAGYIYSKCLLWGDYVLSGEFRILNKCLGVILRATNLSNYIMLQINKEKGGIRPHIRANGGWIPFEAEATGLTFEKEKKLKDGKWYKFEFKVKGELVEIFIFDEKDTLINKSWKITSGRVTLPVYEKEDNKRKAPTHIFDIIATYDYGTFGFRNGHGERALIRNLLVKSINR